MGNRDYRGGCRDVVSTRAIAHHSPECVLDRSPGPVYVQPVHCSHLRTSRATGDIIVRSFTSPRPAPMSDLLITNAALADGRTGIDVLVAGGRIVNVARNINAAVAQTVDANGYLLSPPFVDAHFHMDSTLTYGTPRVNASGTLLEGIALWGELKPALTQDAIVERALAYCDWAVAKGLLAIRSHVDVCDPRLLAVEALLARARAVKPYLDLQLVAFPQDGVLRSAGRARQPEARAGDGRRRRRRHSAFRAHDGRRRRERAHAVRARRRPKAASSTCIATRPTTRCRATSRRSRITRSGSGCSGRVTGSHLTSMHSMDNYYVSKLIPLIAEAGVSAIANPLINITLQGRHDTYPKRRGMTRVPELIAAGVNVAFGHDCVMDPWYSLGSADMLEVAAMGLHVAQMTSQDGDARVLRCGDGERRADPAPRRLRHRARATAPTSCCCRRAIRSRRSGCARRGSRSFRAGRRRRRDACRDARRFDVPGRPGSVDWTRTDLVESIYYVMAWACHRKCKHCYEERFRPYVRGALEAVVAEAERNFPRIVDNFPDALHVSRSRRSAAGRHASREDRPHHSLRRRVAARPGARARHVQGDRAAARRSTRRRAASRSSCRRPATS